MEFQAWIDKVDSLVSGSLGLGLDDLPDCCYADWHEDGVSARDAARMALAAAFGGNGEWE